MELVYDKNRIKHLTNLVQNPGNRKFERKFEQEYNGLKVIDIQQKILGLESAPNAEIYNSTYNHKKEGLEVLSGVGDKDNHIFKTRIKQTNAHRMFMYNLTCTCDKKCAHDCSDMELLQHKCWTGLYAGVTQLFIYDLNYHDYKK